MSNEPVFDLVTADRLQRTQSEINWNLCFLCQNDDIKNLRYPRRKRGKFLLVILADFKVISNRFALEYMYLIVLY